MTKILVYGDTHFSEYSSIIRGLGEKYTVRLENLIKSINWVERLAKNKECNLIVNLGDFFDKPDLTSQEISAFKDINWASDIPHIHLCGNHEMGSSKHEYSSCNMFSVIENHEVISKPAIYYHGEKKIGFLPYILDSNKEALNTYFPEKCDIIFSHNDIKGIQMGSIMSTAGFEIDEIHSCCDLFINGHIHNGMRISNKIINCGNLTGQNFSEDAFNYKHRALIIDVVTGAVEEIENPHAFNFYKVTSCDSFDFSSLKSNAITSIECNSSNINEIKEKIKKSSILFNRFISKGINSNSTLDNEEKSLAIDHIEEFKKFMLYNIANDNLIYEELGEICK